jgi:hypothetical protein
VTDRCLVAFQSIGIPKSLKRYPSELTLVDRSSANDASDTLKKIGLGLVTGIK